MIYLDQAATSYPKPPQVKEAVLAALDSAGSSGRGAHGLSLAASRLIFAARAELAELFGCPDPSRIAFTSNATESLNLALFGLLNPGDHLITTAQEHNSVLRPLHLLQKQGVELTILPVNSRGQLALDRLEEAVQPHTKAVVLTHASNLTGNLIDLDLVLEVCQRHGLILILDAAQTAGWYPYNLAEQPIDILCFTGHKALLGPQGTGGLYVRPGLALKPLKVGGSGVQTFSLKHPQEMPEALEAGTLNAPGLAGLLAGVQEVRRMGLEKIRELERELTHFFYNEVSSIPGVTLYGDFSTTERCPIIALNLAGVSASLVSQLLAERFAIFTRAGGHCAPLLHQALGTGEKGAVRFSFSFQNTREELRQAVEALRWIALEYGRTRSE